MSKHRKAAKVDSNQAAIVQQLRTLPGVEVALGHDDFLIGYEGRTYWIELKSKDAISIKTGKVLDSAIKPRQKKLLAEWTGHYAICAILEQILKEIGYKGKL